MAKESDSNFKLKHLNKLMELIEASENPELALVELMIEQAHQKDEELAAALRFCAIPQHFDAEIIGVLRDKPDDSTTNERLLQSILTYSFALKRKGEGYVYHDNTRNSLMTDWQTNKDRRAQFDELNSRLVSYYIAKYQEGQRAEQELEIVTPIIREASKSRYYQLASMIERLIIPPLLEALYHKTLISAKAGFDLFVSYFEKYEQISYYTVCESLLQITSEYLRKLPPNSGQDIWLDWVSYYQARLSRRSRNYQEAEKTLRKLLLKTEGETKLRLWTLAELGLTLQAQYKLREAQKIFSDQLALAKETREDLWNLPAAYSRVANLHWTFNEFDSAAKMYGEAVQSALEENSTSHLLNARIDLSSVLFDRGDWDEAFSTALLALHQIRTEMVDNPNPNSWVASCFMRFFGKRDPKLLDTVFTEAKTLMATREDLIIKLGLLESYVSLLRMGGQFTRVASEQKNLLRQATDYVNTSFFSSVLLEESLLYSDIGKLDEAINVSTNIIKRSQKGLGTKWDHYAALSNRGLYLGRLGVWSKAKSDLKAAIANWAKLGHERLAAKIKIILADVLRSQGRLSLAQEFLNEARKIIINDISILGDYHSVQGDLYKDQGQWGEARKEYQQAASIALSFDQYNDAAKCYVELAHIAATQANWEEATQNTNRAQNLFQLLANIASYQPDKSAIEADEENAQGMQLFCMPGDHREGRVVQAQGLFRSACERDPGNLWYSLNLMYACAELLEWDSASQAVESILKRDSRWGRFSFFYERLAEYQSKHAEQIVGVGQYEAAGLTIDNAFSALRKASELVPENHEYQKRLKDLQEDLQEKKNRIRLISYFGKRWEELLPVVTPIAVETSSDLIPYVEGEGGLHPKLSTLLNNMREGILTSTGVKIPGTRFRANEDLPDGTYIIMLNEIPVVKGQISKGCRLFPGSSRQLMNLGIVADEAVNPLTTNKAFWIAEQYWKTVESAGFKLWDVIEYPIRHLEAVLRKNLSDFLGHQDVMNLLEASSSEACIRIQNSKEHLTALVQVLKALVSEEVPITDFEQICEKFENLYDAGIENRIITEQMRLIPAIRGKLSGNSNEFLFYQLGRCFEEQIHQSIQTENFISVLILEPMGVQNMLTAIREKVASQKHVALLVRNAELRPFIHKLTEIEFPRVPVLSREELLPELESKIAGEIEVTGSSNVTNTEKTANNFGEKR